MLSWDYIELMRTRARRYLDSAKDNLEKGRYDVGALEAEISAQLIVKAYILSKGKTHPRTHDIRALLSFIVNESLGDQDFLKKLKKFVRDHRKDLIILRRAREASQYGVSDIDEYEARICLRTAELIFEMFSGEK